MEQQTYQQSKKEIDELIKHKATLAEYYENLSYAVESSDGKLIITEINSQLNDINNELFTITNQNLKFPFFEYSKEDLQKMKAYRSQQHVLNSLLGSFIKKDLQDQAKTLKNEVELLAKGEPIEPIY